MSSARGRYVFVELPPYRWGVAQVYYTDKAWDVRNGLIRFVTDLGLRRNVEASHFMLVTALSRRLFPGLADRV